MEGTYFEEALNQARVMGIVYPDIRSRYLYYMFLRHLLLVLHALVCLISLSAGVIELEEALR